MTSINRFLTSQAKYFSECLDARVEYEKSVIWGNSDEGTELETEAYMSARNAGYSAFKMGIDQDDVPGLLQRDENLVNWWKDGWDAADEMLEMSACHGCNDGTGNPCHTHG